MTCNILFKSSWQELQLCFRSHYNRKSTHEVMHPQSRECPSCGNFKTSTWESQDKKTFDVAPVERRKVYYKGEGGGFPQVQAVVSLVCLSCLWLVLAPKVFQLCTNHLVLVLCRSVWVNKSCYIFVLPSRSSSTPFYPFIVLRAREHASTPCPSVVFNLGFTFESRKELGVCHLTSYKFICFWNMFALTSILVKKSN
jgi:hypothetical protein